MKERYSKTVLLPIKVPTGDFCWGKSKICEYFSNEGGYPTCDLGQDVEYNKYGDIPKPPKCRDLREKV